MQPSRHVVLSIFALSLLAAAPLRSAEPTPAQPPPSPAPTKAPGDDPFVKGDGPSANASGKRPAPVPITAVFVQEVYTLKKEDAFTVLEETPSAGDRYQRVLALERDNRARLLTLTALTNKSGDKATVEGIEFVRYPSSYRPPTDAMPAGAALPTNFELRNAGDTWEMDPIIPEGSRTGTISMFSKHVGLLGFTKCPAWPGDPVVEQPRFSNQSLATETAFRLDEPVFLGTFTAPTASGFLQGEGTGEISLAFLRVHALPPAPAGREPVAPAAKAAAPATLTVQYSIYSMERRVARDVVNAGPGADAPWEKLRGLLHEKQAKIEHIFAIATRSGQKSTGEEADEVLYGTQFSAPQYFYPAGAVAPAQAAGKTSSGVVSESGGTKIPGTTEEVEKRNAGLVFELEPVLSPDGSAVDLNHQLSGVTYLGNLDVKTPPAQPLFEARKFASSLTVEAGKHVLAATFNPPSPDGVNGRTKDDGRSTLIFVRVTSAQP